MSEATSKKRASSSGSGPAMMAQGATPSANAPSTTGTKKKARPPPLVVNEVSAIPLPPPQPTFPPIPTMRGPAVYNQQIISSPAAQGWDVAEQTQLERLQRLLNKPSETLLNKSLKVAAHLGKKTARDVAFRIKCMDDSAVGSPARPQDDVDRMLSRSEAIVAELQGLPARSRTEDQNTRLRTLMKDFIINVKEARTKLDAKQPKLPLQFALVPELPDVART